MHEKKHPHFSCVMYVFLKCPMPSKHFNIYQDPVKLRVARAIEGNLRERLVAGLMELGVL